MKLFLKIILSITGVIALIIFGFWIAAKVATRPGPAAEPLSALSQQGLQQAIEGIAAERKLIGVAAKVWVDGTVVAEAATGTRKKNGEAELSADDLFHVGSIGKSMSATAIATLVEDGILSWDDTLGERLATVPMADGWRDVTLSQLLTHRASVPRVPVSSMFETDNEPGRLSEIRRETAAIILAEPPETPPGSAFSYSNEGFMLASIMAEEASGQAWEEIMVQRLAEPLGLRLLGFGAPTGEASPWGHRSLGIAKLALNPVGGSADNPPWMAAAGTMHMRLDDLITYARAHLDAGESEGAILTAETFARLHTPILNDYAYGWVVQSRDLGDGEEPVIWHNGSNTLWYAVVMLLPDRNSVIVLATNDGSQLDQTQRAFDTLSMQIGEAIAQSEG